MFEGQREAAIREHQAGLTVVRTTFRDVPIGISIDPGYSDQLWLKDVRFENVAARPFSRRARNPATQIGVQDAVCVDVPVFARARERRRGSGPVGARRPLIASAASATGCSSAGRDSIGASTGLRRRAAGGGCRPAPAGAAALPSMEQWVNVRTLGVTGDGKADDTKALQAAVDAHRVLYFPTGTYIVRDTIALKRTPC